MELIYHSEKIKKQCTIIKEANKLFGGEHELSIKLMSRINALEQAETLKDIVVQPSFRFHKLINNGKRNLEGCFAMDIKSKKEKWRLILQPLDDNEKPYNPCNIDEISGTVRIVEIREVSKHYE